MKVTGCHLSACFWERTVPRPTPELLVSTQKGSVAMGMAKTGAWDWPVQNSCYFHLIHVH